MESVFFLHRQRLLRWSVYTIILGISSIAFSSCSTHRAIRLRNKSIKDWESHQFEEIEQSPDSEGGKWAIYSRKIAGTNFFEYKIEGNIRSSPKSCVSVFKKEIHKQAADPNNEKYPVYDIVYKTTDSLLTYVIHKEPFPLKNTEMRIRYLFFQAIENNAEVIKWEEAWDEAPVRTLSKKLNRVEIFRGSWTFTPTSSDITSAVNSVQFDPKRMPLWLVKPMVNKFLINGLEDMRSIKTN